ncbi:MAG: M61 family peptidase, partial [Bacteroidetes bacterium]
MMTYTLTFARAAEQLIDVQLEAELPGGPSTFRLPHWRPGRYELQHYARNLGDLRAETLDGTPLSLTQLATHAWEITLPEAASIRLCYVYYATQPDAGGSWFDHDQIYVNGINLFLYRQETIEAPCNLRLQLPAGYQVGGGLPGPGPEYAFADFHQLVDTPFFASPDLIHHQFVAAGIPTHLWFMGACQPDLPRIEADICAYTEAQVQLFGTFPVADYHYLYLMLPHRFRHGVEHHNSTVITMGPGYRLMEPAFYRSFLEISSHELFHTWNVKALRPADMWPYDYRQENYSRLHYITEGITTYYGDLMLWKAGLWTLDEWLTSINGELQRHYKMGGHDRISLEEASFRSWTNGYSAEGIPNRRISFYTKGYLVALLLDLRLRLLTEHVTSLDQVMATF